MTDLPVALLSATAILVASVAFQSWRWRGLILTALFLGTALGTKHSALITLIVVAAFGVLLALIQSKGKTLAVCGRRLGLVTLVLLGSVVVLWSFYLFRFNERPENTEQFNRPLAIKIADVKSPIYRNALQVMSNVHLLPRAYVWGLADTIRAGAEGRADSQYAFGELYYGKAPFYFFPGVLAVKLPVGLLFLSIIGAILLVTRNIPSAWFVPLAGITGLALLFLIVLVSGSSYGGIRPALPIVPLLALLGALAVNKAVEAKSFAFRGTIALGFAVALASAIPVMRPWEYYNELIGGTANGYRYFNDEGLDAALRNHELTRYYDEYLRPTGEIPYIYYIMSESEKLRRGIHWVGEDRERDEARMESEVLSGTFFLGGIGMAPRLWWDRAAFREATPVARFGNLFVFRGTFRAPGLRAQSLYYRAVDELYSNNPDAATAVRLLSESAALDPKAFFVSLELGNQYLKIGKRGEALRAYQLAKEYAPADNDISELLARQIERVATEPLEQISPLRNPEIE